jgi:PAS domain S-box-containing protein
LKFLPKLNVSIFACNFKTIEGFFMTAKLTRDALEKKVKALEKKVVQHKNVEKKLKNALKECRQRTLEVSALQQSCQAVLSYQEFEAVARTIFDRCKKLVGATSGYIVLLDDTGVENKLLFLDAGPLACNVDPALPMPIRGLRSEVYRTAKTVYENDFSNSKWVQYVPEGHVALQNVLFVPLVADGKVGGLLGLANKPGGFSSNDAKITTAFGEMAAIALINSKALEERKRSEAALRESEERFRCITASAQNAIIMMNSQGNISYWNEAAEKVFGYTKKEILGKELHEVLVPKKDIKSFAQGFQKFQQTGKGAAIGKTHEFTALKKDGTEFPIEISLSAAKLRSEWCAVGILRDISDRKQAETELHKVHAELEMRVQERTAELMVANERLQREIEERKQAVAALRASKERFDLAVYGSKDGLWDWDITNNKKYYSPRLKELLGYDEDSEPPETFDDWASGIHPKDYQRVMDALKKHLEHKKVYDVEYLFRKQTGEYSWQHSRGQAIFDGEGKPFRMVGFISDITERKKGEEALRKSEEKYRLLVKNLPSIIYRGFKDWSVEFVDEKIESLSGYNREAFNSRRIKWSDLIIKEDFESARQSFLWALKTNKSYVREYRIKTRAGEIHWIQDRGQIICDNNGEVEYVSGVFF